MSDSHAIECELAVIECELAVIGCGLAGSAAALFASNRGIDTVLVGETGTTQFVSGFLDLLGVHPVRDQKVWSDPWAGMGHVIRDLPRHPYALAGQLKVRAAMDEFLGFLEKAGLPYHYQPGRNLEAPTSLGTIKTTYAVPQSVWTGIECLKEQRPCQLIDIVGLKAFSAAQIAICLQDRWPGLTAASVPFPEIPAGSEVYGEQAAWSLESPAILESFMASARPLVDKDARAIGFPPVLGIHKNRDVISALEAMLGRPVFEIAGPMLGVPGLRLQYAFQHGLRRNGVRVLNQRRVESGRPKGGGIQLTLGGTGTIHAQKVILASGRFLSNGLMAGPDHVRESLFNLPVRFPISRKDWYELDFFDPKGHAINQSGLEVDTNFRPVDGSGNPMIEGLYVAGGILADHDWTRMKTGAGVSIASAHGAVDAIEAVRS